MRKLTFASIVSACMVPALFWSQDSSAIPNWARKYGTSCFTCHSGYPTRNSFGEAFKANGYRWPGGQEEDRAKQEQTKLGGEGWKKVFPAAPWPSDIPGFAPLAISMSGNLIDYKEKVTNSSGVQTTAEYLNWGAPVTANLLYGGTIGENIGFFGTLQGFGTSTTTSSIRVMWSFAPGINLGIGNNFSFFNSGEDISVYTRVLPSVTGTGAEFTYIAGEKSGGINIYAGSVSNGTTSATLQPSTTSRTHLDDIRYLRAEYKLGGSGVLSGAGGVYGNDYNGLDQHVGIGVSVVNAKPNIFGSTFAGEQTVYAVDLNGSYSNFTGGVAYSKNKDKKLNNYAFDAGYYVYPWLLTKVVYTNLGVVGVDKNNPTYTISATAYARANVSIGASYKLFAKSTDPATSLSNQNTFALTTGLAF